MRKSVFLAVGAVGMSVMLSGCAYQVTELNEDEQDQIAAYCAQIVSKYDNSAENGLTTVSAKSSDKADTSEQPASSDATKASETQNTATDGSSEGKKAAEETKTFTEAIGIKDISFLYRDSKTAGGYNSSDVYDLTPDKGNELLVVRLKAVNGSSKSQKIDMPTENLRFQASYGDDTADADLTLLLNDLTTYQGTIKGGKSKNMVMLFQFPKGTIKDTSKVVYTVKKGDTTVRINTDLSKQR
ncbi:MAG: hypothetical protein PUF16_01255 [Lachnospiraceae bacterium]|nr:hypothetical protein [Lachnospiraceae bacterium]